MAILRPFACYVSLLYNHLRMKLSEIAAALGARLENGSPETEITGVAGIETAGPGQITFISNPKYVAAARTTKASAVIVAEDFPAISAAMLRSKNPYLNFAQALELFHSATRYAPGIHPTAVVHAAAQIGAAVHIGPYVVVHEDVEIGANAVLLAHVVIYRGVKVGDNFFAHAHAVVRENCRIGNNVLLHNGVVIGSDGFGFAKTHEGRWHKIPQPASPKPRPSSSPKTFPQFRQRRCGSRIRISVSRMRSNSFTSRCAMPQEFIAQRSSTQPQK